MRNSILFIVIFITSISVLLSYFIGTIFTYIFLFIMSLIFLITFYEGLVQKRHSLKRNFPIIGNIRWIFEKQSPKIQQYFIEDNLNGKPFSREQRSIVYQRAKGDISTIPYGTQHDVYEKNHEFVKHSLFPKKGNEVKGQRILVGSKHCIQPYNSSIMNISAMSYGSLSGAAIRALNLGAKRYSDINEGFAQNTGEGGLSPHHLQGGDIIFQVGTGYFGCGSIDENGERQFNEGIFGTNARLSQVKMIEIKLSQGAKPGHGGILPAKKNTKEISKIRGTEPYTRVVSPPSHSAFTTYGEMVNFIQKLRELSGGKPIGIKLCVGNESEIIEMMKTFRQRDNYPDFITVDGSEGGTGSAPLEFTNNVGTPLREGLSIVVRELKKMEYKDDVNLRKEIKVFASGKIIDTFDMIRVLSLGADGFNMARGFMLSMGCIQARECNKDTCPVGIATQNKSLEKGLVAEHKYRRVARFQHTSIEELSDLIGAMGLDNISKLNSDMVYKRISNGTIKTLKEIYEK